LNAYNIPINDHVNILYDLSEEELIDQYNSHKIFLHPSVLEAGHPNLTLVEALSSGIPVVGTYKGSMDLAGMCVVNDLTPVSYVNAVRHILNNYNEYSTSTQKNQVFEWNYVVKDILGFYKKYGYTLEKFKSVLYNSYIDKNGSHHGYQLPINKIHTSFDDNNNIKLEIIGPEDATYNVKFIGVLHDGQEVIQYQSEIRNNMWCSAQNNNFLQWNVVIDNTLHNIYKIIHT
jgi:hypothetical protein